MPSSPTAAPLPPAEHAALAAMVRRYGLGDVLLDLAASTADEADDSDDVRTVERRGEVARRLLTAAVAAERLRL